jgi:hypothetical protein
VMTLLAPGDPCRRGSWRTLAHAAPPAVAGEGCASQAAQGKKPLSPDAQGDTGPSCAAPELPPSPAGNGAGRKGLWSD